MGEMIEGQVPPELQSQIAFGRLDIDPPQHWDLCRQHNLVNVPFLAFYRDGRLVETLTGLREHHILAQHLRQLTSQQPITLGSLDV